MSSGRRLYAKNLLVLLVEIDFTGSIIESSATKGDGLGEAMK